MRKYYIRYWANFGNTFNLLYVDDAMDIKIPDNWERITRKEALSLARNERTLRKSDPNFAYYGDAEIYPANYHFDDDIINNMRYKLINHIWEKVK